MEKYIRICPVCNETVEHIDKSCYKKALEKNSKCKKCSAKENGKKSIGLINDKNRTGKNIKCEECGKFHYRAIWDLKIDKKFFCSRECANLYHSKKMTRYEHPIKKCSFCEKEFKTKLNRKKYCSVKCASSSNLKTINGKEPKNIKTKPELEFKKILEENEINFIFQKSVQWKHGWKKWYDFYIPQYNILIEIDGIYWHGKNVNTKDLNSQQWNTRKNDKLKNYLAKVRGYNLIRIWSDEIEKINIKQILNCYE